MLRLIISLIGGAMFVLGTVSHFGVVPELVDYQNQAVNVGPWLFSLDVVLIVVGVVFILFAWLLDRLAK